MSVNLNKDLGAKHAVRSMPVRKDDEVTVGSGKVSQVYRKRWCVYIEGLSKSKFNGTPIRVPIVASNCVLNKLKLTKDRENLIARKAANSAKGKGEKYANKDVAA